MKILHAVWQEGRHPNESGLLHLWMETPDQPTTGIRGGPEYSRHPFAASPGDIQSSLEELLDSSFEEKLPEGEAVLFLPTRRGRPLVSAYTDEPADTVRGYVLPTCWMTAGQAALLLSGLLNRPGQAGVHVSADLQVWAATCRWVLALLARERLVPTLKLDGEGKTANLQWMPVLDDANDTNRLKLLADCMPPSARAVDLEIRSSTETITSFVTHAADALSRRWLSEIFGRLPKSYHGWPQGAIQWLTAVYEGKPVIPGVSNELTRLSRDLKAWSEGLITPLRRGFITCFRLHAPASGLDDWKVQIVLQASDDPSLMMDAQELWRPNKHRKPLIEGSQEQLLADLGRALQVFPELERCLRQATPTAVVLSTEEAALFLHRTAWLLEESGFGVQIPSWASKTGTPWSMKLTVTDAGGQSMPDMPSKLGLDSLLSYRWEVAVGDETLDGDEFLALANAKVPLVMVRGRWVLLDHTKVDQAMKLMQQTKTHRMTLGDALRTASSIEEGLGARVEFQGSLTALNGEEALSTLDAPTRFQGTLRPYQLRGYSWLTFLKQRGLGACLADDMGLGKTIQLIAMMLRERETGATPGPTLLVCPTSVLGNWVREVNRFAPSLKVILHHGPGRRHGQGFIEQAQQHDLIVTTYALVPRDLSSLTALEWDSVVLDEAQNIKNPEAQQARGVRRLRARSRVALTGTPVENRLSDLWSVMEFLNPGLLGTAENFRKRFAYPIERFNHSEAVARLRTVVQPFILRRLKTDTRIIQDLPEKQEMKTYCPLTREQASLYQAAVRSMLSKVEEATGMTRRGLILQTMLRLKQICDHPALYMNDNSTLDRRSGKLMRLLEMLEEAQSAGHRALIFTQFAQMGKMLQQHLTNELGCDVLFLYGEVPQKERERIITRFQSDDGPPFLVLSLKAGGVGLNLTQASHVFHFDRWWNPAVENQATDRAFRIGQTKNVQVHKFICSGTLEEAIDEMIESKVALARQVVGAGEDWLTELSNEQLRQLLTLKEDDVEDVL